MFSNRSEARFLRANRHDLCRATAASMLSRQDSFRFELRILRCGGGEFLLAATGDFQRRRRRCFEKRFRGRSVMALLDDDFAAKRRNCEE